MTRQENLKIVREAVVRAVPEIMELKFGCEIALKKPLSNFGQKIVERFGDSTWKLDDNNFRFVGERGWIDAYDILFFRKENVEILGRPIHLADVLVAVEEHIKAQWLTSAFPDETIGNFQPYLENTGMNTMKQWNLRADSLDQQSDETLEFLAKLLANK